MLYFMSSHHSICYAKENDDANQEFKKDFGMGRR
jgi:hypothetical protein